MKTLFRYDSDCDGVVSVREVALVFRCMGYNPTEAELQVILKKDEKDFLAATAALEVQMLVCLCVTLATTVLKL